MCHELMACPGPGLAPSAQREGEACNDEKRGVAPGALSMSSEETPAASV